MYAETDQKLFVVFAIEPRNRADTLLYLSASSEEDAQSKIASSQLKRYKILLILPCSEFEKNFKDGLAKFACYYREKIFVVIRELTAERAAEKFKRRFPGRDLLNIVELQPRSSYHINENEAAP